MCLFLFVCTSLACSKTEESVTSCDMEELQIISCNAISLIFLLCLIMADR